MGRLAKTLMIGIALLVLGGREGYGIAFTDVPQDAWYAEDLKLLQEKGAVSGYPSESGLVYFRPERSVTRAEFVKMALHVLSPGDESVLPLLTEAPFSDVPVSAWFADFVAYAKRCGALDTSQTFFPDSPITRQDAARILVKLMEHRGGVRLGSYSAGFLDTSDLYIALASQGGLVKGYPDQTFRPGQLIDRASAVALLARALRNLSQAQDPAFSMTAYSPSRGSLPEVPQGGLCPRVGVLPNKPETDDSLVRVGVQTAPLSDPGSYFVLRRSNADIKVWSSQKRSAPALLGQNDEYILPPQSLDIYVELVSSESSVLSLELRRGSNGAPISSRRIEFSATDLVVVVLDGETYEDSGPPPNPFGGIGDLARMLHERGYEVLLRNEYDVDASGAGPVFAGLSELILQRSVRRVAFVGFSRGGGAVWSLVDKMSNASELVGRFEPVFTAYIDALENHSDFDPGWESREPPGSLYHVNYYRSGITFPRGVSIPTAEVNKNVLDEEWGRDLCHTCIDESPELRNDLLSRIMGRVRP